MLKEKIKIIFVNESLSLAGGEKSLIALLSNLNPHIYAIDLQLFRYGEALDSAIPAYVNVLPPLSYSAYSSRSWRDNLKNFIKGKDWNKFISKISYTIKLRTGTYNHPQKAQMYWECVNKSIEMSNRKYDVAIAYAQGVPTFYVRDKIVASTKATWMNVNVKFPPKTKRFNFSYYANFDKVVAVSDVTKEHFATLFPTLQDKVSVLYDMIDFSGIISLADKLSPSFNSRTFNILTVARLNKTQKGYDIALEACKILKENNVSFHWYALGTGPYKEEMCAYIKTHGLENNFTFLGTTPNPYPYFKAADLYVQTSRHEGFGLSIAEARLLNTPVVTTRFDTVFMQMVDGKNGLVTDMNAGAVAEAIMKLMNDQNLYDSIVEYLKKERKENTETIEKFDKMIIELIGESIEN